MKDIGTVFGDAQQAVPLIIGTDTVYVHNNIIPILQDNNGFSTTVYKFNEIQYEKDEYIKVMAEKNNQLDEQLTNTQLALTEIYESINTGV